MKNKFLKEARRVFIHIRWPLQSYALFGFLFTILVLNLEISEKIVFGFISWSLLWIGATLFDSYYDKDDKPVAGLPKPPKISKSLLYGAWLFKIIGFIFALQVNNIFQGIYIMGALASIGYSHKNFRLKSSGYFSLFANFCTGVATFVAFSSFLFPHPKTFFLGITTIGFFQASTYLIMQIHQVREDKIREDKSIAVVFGKKKALSLATMFLAISGIFGILTFFEANLPKSFIIISGLYFLILIGLILRWRSKKQNPKEDFKTMNKLTIYSSYIANTVLLITYIFRIKSFF